MQRFIMKWSVLVLGVLIVAGPGSANAQLYLKPRAGASIPVRGSEGYYSVGGTLGYQWIKLFSTEVTYTRLLSFQDAPNGHTVRGQGVFRVPVGIFTPYASIGAGWVRYEAPIDDSQVMTLFGGGVSLAKILFFSLSVGADYAIVPDQPDFLEPYVSMGVVF